jgi:hypothetical protein
MPFLVSFLFLFFFHFFFNIDVVVCVYVCLGCMRALFGLCALCYYGDSGGQHVLLSCSAALFPFFLLLCI